MKRILSLSLFLFFVCCQQDENFLNKKVTVSNDPILVGKRLAFNSQEHLNFFVNSSKNRELIELKAKISKFEESGFRSLLPTFESADLQRVDEYKKRKVTLNPSGRAPIESMDAEEDEVVYDPNFALVLNDDREIIVEDKVYKFTEYAVFYTETDNDAEIANYVEQAQNCELVLPPGKTYIGNNVYAFIPEPVDDICDYEVDPDDVTYVPASILSSKEQFMQNMSTCIYEEHGFDHLFGPSKKCIDKFASDRRIKTRAWNQNFLIYSSVGVRTKTQKRTLGIWWASDSDEIELGYEIVKYMFEGVDMTGILNQIRTNSQGLNYVYSYNGYLLNQYGIIASNNNWGSGATLFDRWPVTDGDTRVLKIYLGDDITNFISKIDAGLTTIDGKEVNSAAKALAKQGWDAVTKYLKQQSSGGTVIVGGNPYQQKFYFVYTDWKDNNKDDNRISKVFDFNTAQIGFTWNPSSGATSWNPLESTSKSYKEFSVSCYGIARRGSEWRGNRIAVVQKK